MREYIKVKSLDGVDVEVTHSDAAHPPDTGGLNLNTTAVWIRPAGESWIKSPHRSAIVTADIISRTKAAHLAALFLIKEIANASERPKAIGSGSSKETATKLQSLQGHSTSDADKHPAGTTKK